MMANNDSAIHVHINLVTVTFTSTLSLIVMVLGAVCNGLAIVTISRTKNLISSSINRAVLSLCFADLLTVFLDVPLTTTILIGNHLHFMPWSESFLCDIQAFGHTLSNSIQIMAFPVIGMERYFSIRHPFEKEQQIKRVKILTACVWGFGLSFAIIAVFVFPTTTVSLYCNRTPLHKETVSGLFHKIYFFTLPLGIICVIITVICYGLIVWRVRQQNRKSLAKSKQSQSQRARSHSGPTFTTGSGVFFRSQSQRISGSFAQRRNHSLAEVTGWTRRVSLPLHERRTRRKSGGEEVSTTMAGKKRPALRKEDAVCFEDDEKAPVRFKFGGSMDESLTCENVASPNVKEGREMRHLSIPSVTAAGARSVSVASSASSNVTSDYDRSRASSTLNSFDEDSSVFTEPNSFEDEKANNNGKNHRKSWNFEAPRLASNFDAASPVATPTIAITMADASPRKESKNENGDNYRQFSFLTPLRRCKSALSRTASVGSEMSILSTPIVVHDADGNIQVYNKKRSAPEAIQDSKGAVCVRDSKARELGKRRSEAKTAKKSSYIVLTFLAFWLPLPVSVGVSYYYVDHSMSLNHLQWHLDMQLGAFCVGMITVVTNPIIYGLAIRSFRIAFKKLSRKDWKRFKNSLPHCRIKH